MYLKVIANTEVHSETTQRDFIRTTFQVIKSFAGDREIVDLTAPKAARIYNLGKAPELGSLGEGEIKHFETSPYTITDANGVKNSVSKFSCLVFEGENPVEVANNLLARNSACVVIGGKMTKDLKPIADAKATPKGKTTPKGVNADVTE